MNPSFASRLVLMAGAALLGAAAWGAAAEPKGVVGTTSRAANRFTVLALRAEIDGRAADRKHLISFRAKTHLPRPGNYNLANLPLASDFVSVVVRESVRRIMEHENGIVSGGL